MHTNLSSIAQELKRFFVESLGSYSHKPDREESRPTTQTRGPLPLTRRGRFTTPLPQPQILETAHGKPGNPVQRSAAAHPTIGSAPPVSFPQTQRTTAEHFNRFALRLFRLQHAVNQPYRAFCQARGITPADVTHWRQIPAIPTSAFKEFVFSCLPESDRTSYFESSGTTKTTRSRTYHCRDSLALYGASLLPWFERHVLPATLGLDEGATRRRLDLISLTPPIMQAPHSSLVHMLDVISRQGLFHHVRFVSNSDGNGAWTLNLDACLAALQESCCQDRPVTLVGTAFSYLHLLDALKESPIRLPQESRIMETGGYKGRTRDLPKDELHAQLACALGVSRHSIVTEYGMTELGSQAYDQIVGDHSSRRTLQFPPWAAATVVSCETGLEVAEGEAGLVRVVDLANAFSVVAVETEDLAIRHREGIELLGRRAMAEPRGCSLMTL